MRLWLLEGMLFTCHSVWSAINRLDDENITNLREDYADQLIYAGLIEGIPVSTGMAYRRTELGELLITVMHRKPFHRYMELDEIMEVLREWENRWQKYEDDDDEIRPYQRILYEEEN